VRDGRMAKKRAWRGACKKEWRPPRPTGTRTRSDAAVAPAASAVPVPLLSPLFLPLSIAGGGHTLELLQVCHASMCGHRQQVVGTQGGSKGYWPGLGCRGAWPCRLAEGQGTGEVGAGGGWWMAERDIGGDQMYSCTHVIFEGTSGAASSLVLMADGSALGWQAVGCTAERCGQHVRE
jgi:hypothetical protein